MEGVCSGVRLIIADDDNDLSTPNRAKVLS